VPNWFQDISTVLDRKLKALECYSDEMRPWPHSRSLDAVTHLARWRGASAGLEAAEAFMLARRIST
jgi:LmbE family N-acetylglucosaminyl deacetylase